MATRTLTPATLPPTTDYEGIILASWSGMTFTSTDDGAPAEYPNYSDRSVQVTGTLGVGGSVRIEGSMNGTDWAPLTDPQGNDLNLTTLKIEAISEATRYIRPRITAGDGTTNLVVTIMFKRAR
jgi:hypothetical protein